MADRKAQVFYENTNREDAKPVAISYCREKTTKDKAEDSRVGNLALRVDEHFRAHIAFETPSDDGASIMSFMHLRLS